MLLGVDRVRNLASGSRDPTRDQLGEAVAWGSSSLMRQVNDNDTSVNHIH